MNLVIDGNAFLNVSLNVVKQLLYFDKTIGANFWVDDLMNGGFVLKDGAKTIFRDFTIKYLNSITNGMTDLKYVFMPFDLKNNWRIQYLDKIEDCREIEYKGNRTYDEKGALFFQYFYDEVLPEVEKSNIIKLKVQGAEGDDVVVRIIENYKEDDFCIWSVDLDFFQLVTNFPRFVMLSTPKQSRKTKNVYTHSDYKNRLVDNETSFDIFNLAKTGTVDYIDILLKRGHTHVEVNPNKEFLNKVLAGDNSDNIPRVNKKMTPKKVDFIRELILDEKPNFIEQLDLNTIEIIKYIAEHIIVFLKITDVDEMKNLKRALVTNVKLMRLSSKFIPEKVIIDIDERLSELETNQFHGSVIKKILMK